MIVCVSIGAPPQEKCVCTYGETEPSCMYKMMVTDLVRERQEYGGHFPEGTYQLRMRLIAKIHTLHCLIKCDYYIAGILVGIVCGLTVQLLISVMLAIIYCVYRQRGKFTSGGGARKSNVNPVYQPGGGKSNVELHYEIVQCPEAVAMN